MVDIERAGHWTGQLEWLPTDRFAKSAPDWAASEVLGRAPLGRGRGPSSFRMSMVDKLASV